MLICLRTVWVSLLLWIFSLGWGRCVLPLQYNFILHSAYAPMWFCYSRLHAIKSIQLPPLFVVQHFLHSRFSYSLIFLFLLYFPPSFALILPENFFFHIHAPCTISPVHFFSEGGLRSWAPFFVALRHKKWVFLPCHFVGLASMLFRCNKNPRTIT